MPDSLLYIIDTTDAVKPDTLLLNDSLLRADSLAVADSLNLIIPAPPVRMEGILHLSSPGGESWVFIMIGILSFFLIAGLMQSAGMAVQNLRFFLSRRESMELISGHAPNVAQYRLFSTIFAVCVFALLVYEMAFQVPEKFEFLTFGILCVIFAGYYLLKYTLFEIIGNTFFDGRTTKNYKSMYFGMLNLLAVFLFPILVLYTYQPESWKTSLETVVFILVGVFYIALIIKLFQIFYSKPLALFYIFLYLCTLEILPILILIRVCEKFI